jgi:mRNA-degrading endonuclease RelE of RelBE toxin-antitoxin system
MTKVVLSKSFNKDAKSLFKKYRSLAKDVVHLIKELETNPEQGIPLGKDCFKIRLNKSSKQSGKSGGARVITHLYIQGDIVTLIAIYDKSSQSSISDAEIERRLNEID